MNTNFLEKLLLIQEEGSAEDIIFQYSTEQISRMKLINRSITFIGLDWIQWRRWLTRGIIAYSYCFVNQFFFNDDIYQVGHSLIYMLHKMQADDEMENI